MSLQWLRPGFRFNPTGEAEIYGDKEPWKLFNPNHYLPYWVFAQLKKKRDSDSVTKQTTKKKGKGAKKTKKKRKKGTIATPTVGLGKVDIAIIF
ncbi:hypothetical protein CCACVL1_25539 [Corchorus capsularis]|uniref:Uncharacterized protein n=1 Tax=Corchorus capsularis TaxID=210143 RepID=A0A1R3GJE9_COCAP|nr:hypothetical protein CCACVL1_25539 [Corchorus capsularis]